ncbi:MAG: hypothetical protein PUH84_01905 [Firmicutes bacterium]|nr:hypothetical protein [Bacillota bacterium]MDY5335612.1 hypothetical protein [Bacilli bacterium]
MKKISNIISFLLLILLYNFTKDCNMFLLTLSFSMLIIYTSIFSTTSIKSKLETLYNKKYYYSINKIFKNSIILVTIITLVLTLISYLTSLLINIKGLSIVNISMCVYLLTSTIIKLEGEYISIIKSKKLGNNLLNIYNIVNNILLLITIILLYKVFKLENYLNISILYLISLIPFIIINILIYIFIFKNKKEVQKREENKLNYIKETKKILVTNKISTIFNIIQSSYIYLIIVILYSILTNKYNYNYDTIGIYITSIYFYGINTIYFIYKIIKSIYIDKFNEIKDKIINKENYNLINIINKIVSLSISLTILLIIISKPLNNLLFNNKDMNIILNVSYILVFYILYNLIINLNIICNKEKNIIITLFTGLIITLITSIPIINSSYRMGYNLVGGSLISIILGITISIIIGIILIKKKLKLSLLNNFNDILNMIYENIIYSLVLVLFTFIVKVNINSIIKSILVIIFYIFITIIFYITKEKITKKKVQ